MREHGGTEEKHLCRTCCATTFVGTCMDKLKYGYWGSSDQVLVSQLAGQRCPTCHPNKFGAQWYRAIS
jgi:hypothetical protein